MAIVIDGITLPEFPEGFLDETNKYYTVFYMDFGDMEGVPDDETIPPMYMAIASSSPAFYVPKELNSLNANAFGMIAFICDVESTMTMYEVGAVDTWENPIPYLKGMGFAVENIEAAGFLATPKRANYDIKTATQFTKTDEPYTVGDEIYFPNSEKPTSSLPPYLCESSDWYKAVANEIRRIAKNYSSFEFDKDSIEKALYGGNLISEKSVIEGTYSKIVVPASVNVNNPYIFKGCTSLKFVDLGKANQIHVNTLQYEGMYITLDTLIMRSETVVTVNGITGTSYKDYPLQGTHIDRAEGYIYVPSALVDSYKNDSVNHWSKYADQFRAIEDYPDICGSL